MNIRFSADVTLELRMCLIAFVLGVCLKIAYDILRILRRIIRRGIILVSLEDIIFFVITGFFLFGAMYIGNDGRVRLYALCFVGLGAYLYEILVGRYIFRLIVKGIFFVKKSLKKLLKIMGKQCNIISERHQKKKKEKERMPCKKE